MATYRNPNQSLMQSEHYDEIEKEMFIKSGKKTKTSPPEKLC